jgi:osmoprotectant transport system substrate-binding protein
MCATQGAIAQLGLVVLADDKAIQPPGGVQPIVRTDYLARYAVAADRNAFLFVLDGVSAQLTTDELTKIGVKIDVEHQPLADVARQWLTDQGLPRAGGGNTTP